MRYCFDCELASVINTKNQHKNGKNNSEKKEVVFCTKNK